MMKVIGKTVLRNVKYVKATTAFIALIGTAMNTCCAWHKLQNCKEKQGTKDKAKK